MFDGTYVYLCLFTNGFTIDVNKDRHPESVSKDRNKMDEHEKSFSNNASKKLLLFFTSKGKDTLRNIEGLEEKKVKNVTLLGKRATRQHQVVVILEV